MTFFDWWAVLGTGIQSVFAWAAYNRDAFVDNAAMRQSQQYQKKNYHIGWIAIARDDIRDMMGISVNRINNYMIVATLILSVAAGTIAGVSFNENSPTYVVFAFYVCMGVALIYLMLAIMLGVKGQNSAFTNTMKLLTYQVRPENPAEYTHDYMKQAQWIEKNGLMGLFRIPGIMPDYLTDTQDKHDRAMVKRVSGGRAGVDKVLTGGALEGKDPGHGSPYPEPYDNLEDATPLESLVKRSTHTWYLTKFAQFMNLWNPYDVYSKYSMGFGIIALGHGSAYFALGKLVSEGRYMDDWAALVLTFAFVYMVVLVTSQNFRAKHEGVRYAVCALLAAGPFLGAVGAVNESELSKQICVPASFLCHFVFWASAFLSSEKDLQDPKLDLVNNGRGFWTEPKSAGEKKRLARDYLTGGADVEVGQAQGSGGGRAARYRASPPYGLPVDTSPAGAGGFAGAAAGPLSDDHALPADGSMDHWPTDDREFHEKAQASLAKIKFTVRLTLAFSALLWLAMFVWAALRYWVQLNTFSFRPALNPPTAGMEELPASWPSPLFRPQALACGGGSVFAADRFRVFEISPYGQTAALPIQCSLERPIVDVTTACDIRGRCRPLVLVHGQDQRSEVVDCLSGEVMPLLQDTAAVEHLEALPASFAPGANATRQGLLAARGGEMVQFAWSPSRGAFEPEWSLGSFDFLTTLQRDEGPRQLAAGEGLRALGVAGNRLWFFRRIRSTWAAVEARELSSMEDRGRWALPAGLGPLVGACAWDRNSALVLSEPGASSKAAPRLTRLTFG